jgi:hypothetical protein
MFSVLDVFSARRSKNQFLFMFTGCVKCCTFLFIDVIVGWFVVLFVLCCLFKKRIVLFRNVLFRDILVINFRSRKF